MIVDLDIDKINGVNIAEDRKDLKVDLSIVMLSKSIKTNGLIHPIVVRQLENNTYRIVCGQRRLLACKLLGYSKISAIVKSFDSTKDEMIMILHENSFREDLNKYDEFFLKISLLYFNSISDDSEAKESMKDSESFKLKALSYVIDIKNLTLSSHSSLVSKEDKERIIEFTNLCEKFSIKMGTLLNNIYISTLHPTLTSLLKEQAISLFVARQSHKFKNWEHVEELYSFLIEQTKNKKKMQSRDVINFVESKKLEKRKKRNEIVKIPFNCETLITNIKKLNSSEQLAYLEKINSRILKKYNLKEKNEN